MSESYHALVTAELLVWARSRNGLPLDRAAARVRVAEAKLRAWESGELRPSVRQARLLAREYRVPFAAFYLATPPIGSPPVPRDYRSRTGSRGTDLSTDLIRDIEQSWSVREAFVELRRASGDPVPKFDARLSRTSRAEAAGAALRQLLRFDVREQMGMRNARLAFNAWRAAAERCGALVFQTSALARDTARAYSLWATYAPVLVVSRREGYAPRSFSLLHELVHVAVRTAGICDMRPDDSRSPKDHRLEVFCNAVAAVCLMPRTAIEQHEIVWHHEPGSIWEEERIRGLATDFAVSREAVLRRLLTLGYTTENFYRTKRAQYEAEYRRRPRATGPISPAQNVLSLRGRPFVRAVLTTLAAKRITSTEAVQYLGVRAKHLSTLARLSASLLCTPVREAL